MPQIIWSQDEFSRGELSPMLYGRTTLDAYYKSLKKAQNTITYPQGGIGKRFGTIYTAEITGVTDWRDIFFETFPYKNECTYVLVFVPGQVEIYLENELVATVANAILTSHVIRTMDWTILEDKFEITADIIQPHVLSRASLAANPINTGAGIVANQFTLTNPVAANLISAARFINAVVASMPSTTPQILIGVTYFIRTDATGTLIKVYANARDAANDTNAFTLNTVGAGTTNVLIANNWTLAPIVFINLPQYDFGDVNYITFTFTPTSVTVGTACTITSSGNIFTPEHVGGSIFISNGVVSFTAYVSATQMTGTVTSTLSTLTAQLGRLVEVREPAWSTKRGFPSKCSSFQSRAIFANTDALPNGLWLSAINDFSDFDELSIDPADDDAISYFPSSDTVNVIKFIVPYRSLTVHTNSAIFSSPLIYETALTPKTFSLQLQDSTPATAIQPQGIDNQIIIISGNDVHTMLWDGGNNSYMSNIVSVSSEHLISAPHDEVSFQNLNRAGSRYIFIINDDGSLVVYQTLMNENVTGFTSCITGEINDDKPELRAYFRWGASSPDGRAWFVVERKVANELVAPFTYSTKYFIEELSFNVFSDCSHVYSGPPVNTIAGLPRFNGKDVVMQGDGYGFQDSVTNSTVEFIAHGQPTDVTKAFIGLPINMVIQTLPNAPPGATGPKGTSLVYPQHIRNATFMFNNTIGGEIDGQPITLLTLSQYNPLSGPLSIVGPPVPQTGIFSKSLMKGWNEFLRDPITITHSDPFDIRLIGVYYRIEE
jgi:hypothetical protein